MSLSEISRAMQSQPSAIFSMIELLVRKGKLLEIGTDGKNCSTCGLTAECNLLAARGRRYVAAPPQKDKCPVSPSPKPDSALEIFLP